MPNEESKQVEGQAEVPDEGLLFSVSSTLADEGFGTFDRCLMAARTMDGDMEKSKQVLSNLIISEASLQKN